MKISLSSDDFEIIAHGVAFAFDEDSGFTFDFDNENGFRFSLEICFNNDDTGKLSVKREIKGNKIILTCANFLDAGSGTSQSIEIAVVQGKRLYLRFWSYMEGNVQGQKKSRKIEYTIFRERKVVSNV